MSDPLIDSDDADALRWVMAQPQGRRVLSWIFQQAGMYKSTYDPNTGSASAFAEGNRNIGLKLLTAMTGVDPLVYPQLLFTAADRAMKPQEQTDDDA